jgi:hypothetical protein
MQPELWPWGRPAEGAPEAGRIMWEALVRHFADYLVNLSGMKYAANLTNGFGRAESWPNLWISAAGLPQWLRLRWKQPVRIGRIELVFDTQLDYADQMYGFPPSKRDFAIPCGWTTIARASDNYHRRAPVAGADSLLPPFPHYPYIFVLP